MNQNNISNPHDKFFKESFGRKDIAISFLKEYLPASIHKKLKYESLEIIKDSFIDKELAEHFSDILYKIKIGTKNTFLYLLFEHKSYADNWVGFQLLRNMVKIWEGCLKQCKKKTKLPVIVPIIIYHGIEKWNVNCSLSALFDVLPETNVYVPDFKTEVYDISHIPDEQIKGEILLQACFLLQKYVFNPELIGKVPEILGILNKLSTKTKATEYLEVMLRYLWTSVDNKNHDALKTEIIRTIKAGGTAMPTIAEAIKLEEKLEITQKMIEKGMTNAVIKDITGLSIKAIENLRKSLKAESLHK